MRSFKLEISKPANADDFEDFCADVYSDIFSDPLPKRNGRSGQHQGGVDIFLIDRGVARVGIQCKRYWDKKLTKSIINKEISAADERGWDIRCFIFATTLAADSLLEQYVQRLSDSRAKLGKFTVDIEFWSHICRHVSGNAKLQKQYSPNSPGGMFDEIQVKLDAANTMQHLVLNNIGELRRSAGGMEIQLEGGERQSIEILSQLKQKYALYLRSDISSVKFVQSTDRCYLEITVEERIRDDLIDEVSKRTDLGFISGAAYDTYSFSPQKSLVENAKRFVYDFDVVSIINCTDLFTHEAAMKIDEYWRRTGRVLGDD